MFWAAADTTQAVVSDTIVSVGGCGWSDKESDFPAVQSSPSLCWEVSSTLTPLSWMGDPFWFCFSSPVRLEPAAQREILNWAWSANCPFVADGNIYWKVDWRVEGAGFRRALEWRVVCLYLTDHADIAKKYFQYHLKGQFAQKCININSLFHIFIILSYFLIGFEISLVTWHINHPEDGMQVAQERGERRESWWLAYTNTQWLLQAQRWASNSCHLSISGVAWKIIHDCMLTIVFHYLIIKCCVLD